MSQKIQMILIDDLDPEVAATGTVAFALDGSMYEIDLSEEHAGGLRDALAPYVGAGRRTGGKRAARPARQRAGTPSSSTSEAAAPDPGVVRAWAREHNVAVSERGRIKGTVLAQFLEATR